MAQIDPHHHNHDITWLLSLTRRSLSVQSWHYLSSISLMTRNKYQGDYWSFPCCLRKLTATNCSCPQFAQWAMQRVLLLADSTPIPRAQRWFSRWDWCLTTPLHIKCCLYHSAVHRALFYPHSSMFSLILHFIFVSMSSCPSHVEYVTVPGVCGLRYSLRLTWWSSFQCVTLAEASCQIKVHFIVTINTVT